MTALKVIQNKICTRQEFNKRLNLWRFKDEKLVFTNGCFDILHQGHVDYLSRASDLGTKLIVGVNSDDSVRRLGKGEGRPLQDQNSRSLILASLQFVDQVIIFDEDTPLELIKLTQPDVLVKGSDYKIEEIVGHDVVLAKGGKVIPLDFLEGYSTSRIVEKARQK